MPLSLLRVTRARKGGLVIAPLPVLAAMSFILACLFLASPAKATIAGPTPIQHVVIVDLENHRSTMCGENHVS
jgi:hypothetical protein